MDRLKWGNKVGLIWKWFYFISLLLKALSRLWSLKNWISTVKTYACLEVLLFGGPAM